VFLHLKTFLGDWWLYDEVKEAVDTWLASQVASFYDSGIQSWCLATSASTMVETYVKK
jgi:hypothetical protein